MHSPPQKTIIMNTNKIEIFKLTIKIILKIVNNNFIVYFTYYIISIKMFNMLYLYVQNTAPTPPSC